MKASKYIYLNHPDDTKETFYFVQYHMHKIETTRENKAKDMLNNIESK